MGRTYFISYSWARTGQAGFGNTYVDTPGPLTRKSMQALHAELERKFPGSSIVILNVVELAG